MSLAKITLIGFNNYMHSINDDLFKLLDVPPALDKELLVNTILLRGGEFEVLYSNPEFMQSMIGVWSGKWYRTMFKWVSALAIEYNPLENYDRKENWVELSENNLNKTETALAQDASKATGSGNTTNTRSAYDSAAYQPHDKVETSTGGDNLASSATNAIGNAKTHDNSVRNGRAHGNIGVTTSQQMLQAELDISRFNIYEAIAELFLTEFVLYVY